MSTELAQPHSQTNASKHNSFSPLGFRDHSSIDQISEPGSGPTLMPKFLRRLLSVERGASPLGPRMRTLSDMHHCEGSSALRPGNP